MMHFYERNESVSERYQKKRSRQVSDRYKRYKRRFYFTKSKLKGAFHRGDHGTITSLQRGDVWLVSQGFLTVSHSECGSPHWNKDPLRQHH